MAVVEACAAEESGESLVPPGPPHSSPEAIAELVQDAEGPFDSLGFPVVAPSLDLARGEREEIIQRWREGRHPSLGASLSNLSVSSRSPSAADFWDSPSPSLSPRLREEAPLSPSQRILRHRATMNLTSPHFPGGGSPLPRPRSPRGTHAQTQGTVRAAMWPREVGSAVESEEGPVRLESKP